MRRILKQALVVACLSVLALFVARDASAAGRPLRLSTWKLPFNLPVMWEIKHGSYGKFFSGMDVKEVNLPSGPRQMSAIAAGDLDVAQGIGDVACLVAAAGGIDARIIAVNSRSPKAFAVMAVDPKIKSMADLKGKKAAGVKGSVVYETYIKALAEVSLKATDLEFYPMTIAQAGAALIAGKVDVALLVGSEILAARKAGARVLADGEGRVSGTSLVLASARFLEANPGFPENFRKMRAETVKAIKANQKAALSLAGQEIGADEASMKEMLSWYDFEPVFSDADREALERTQQFLLEQGILKKPVEVMGLLLMVTR